MKKKTMQKVLTITACCIIFSIYVLEMTSVKKALSNEVTLSEFILNLHEQEPVKAAEPIADIGCIMTIDDLI